MLCKIRPRDIGAGGGGGEFLPFEGPFSADPDISIRVVGFGLTASCDVQQRSRPVDQTLESKPEAIAPNPTAKPEHPQLQSQPLPLPEK